MKKAKKMFSKKEKNNLEERNDYNLILQISFDINQEGDLLVKREFVLDKIKKTLKNCEFDTKLNIIE